MPGPFKWAPLSQRPHNQPAMTDPKALIERLGEIASYLRAMDQATHTEIVVQSFTAMEEAAQALRDLTAEKERIQDRANVWQLKAEMAEVKIARLKALGNGLAYAIANGTSGSAVLAAWETRHDD